MQTSQSYNHIKVDSPSKERSPFNWNHDNNTTGTFGLFQPLLCRTIVPKSKTVMSIDPIVYMAPMVAPTVGRMNYETYSCFIGMSDLLPKSFAPFLAKKSYARSSGVGVQQYLPSMPLQTLSAFCLVGAHFCVYKRTSNTPDNVSKSFAVPTQSEVQNLINDLRNNSFINGNLVNSGRYPGYSGFGFLPSMFLSNLPNVLIPGSNDINTPNSWLPDYSNPSGTYISAPVTLESADFVFEREFNGTTWAFCVRLSSYGKQWRKIMIGLGYQVNFTSHVEVNVLPFFAYYKAYFDSFGLTLYQNWESTRASLILTMYDNGDSSALSFSNPNFANFVTDCVNTYYTDSQDYISAHQRTDVVSSGEDGFINNVIYVDQNGPSVTTQDSSSESATVVLRSKGAYINKVNHTEVDAQLLMRLARFTNRNTIAGQRIEELLRVGGYGDWLASIHSYFIGKTSTPLEISRVTATSDSTNAVLDKDCVLGEFAGQGYGHSKSVAEQKFSFENDEFGYWMTIGAIVPRSGYCQGVDQTLLAITPENMYQREFDAVGYESSLKLVVKGSADWYDNSLQQDFTTQAFGLVPRHTRWKQLLNKCNGDFSLRGTRNALLPYTFDKFIDADDGFVRYIDSQGVNYVELDSNSGQLPIAGNAWRYNSRYPWLSSLQRIFTRYLQDALMFSPSGFEEELPAREADFMYLYNDDDNFYIFNSFDMTCYAPMLPISESYGTLEEESKGNASLSKS